MIRWSDGNEKAQAELEQALRAFLVGNWKQFPAPCPACSVDTPNLHLYLHSPARNQLGGCWVWCSNCHVFMHGSIHPPSWWNNLEIIDPDKLSARPTYLDELNLEIDRHCNDVIQGVLHEAVQVRQAPT